MLKVLAWILLGVAFFELTIGILEANVFHNGLEGAGFIFIALAFAKLAMTLHDLGD